MCHKVCQILTQEEALIRAEQLIAKGTTDITPLAHRTAQTEDCSMMGEEQMFWPACYQPYLILKNG